MAGRHGVHAASGVSPAERRTHARQAATARRRRTRHRDAAQSWGRWLAVRALVGLPVLVALVVAGGLWARHRGGVWPVIAVVAGGCSLILIAVEAVLRRRHRAGARRGS